MAPARPSEWIVRWAAELVPPGAHVLDLACGSGRHTRWLAERGWRVTAVDRDAAATAPLREMAEVIVADLESGPWPLGERRFDAIVVTHYLHRPLFGRLTGELLQAGGTLLYETFGQGQATVGRPSNPDFLLRPGELLEAAAGLHIVAYENGFEDSPSARFVQRVAAVRHRFDPERPARHRLSAGGSAQGG